MKMTEDGLGIKVVDAPISKAPTEIDDREFPRMLFKGYDVDSITDFNVIEYESYDMYDKEVVPNLDNIVGLSVYNTSNRLSSKIVGYDNGIMKTEVGVGAKMYKYSDELIIARTEDDKESKNDDYVLVSSIYNFNKTMTGASVEEYRRFDIMLFTYDDLNADKSNYLMRELQRVFNRDFMLLGENGEKTKQCAYISSQLRFDIGEYNITNRVIRGSMLLKIYTK
ncbi:MAG: hypothetical protein ACRCZ1_07735 [Cetobacterium sp.]